MDNRGPRLNVHINIESPVPDTCEATGLDTLVKDHGIAGCVASGSLLEKMTCELRSGDDPAMQRACGQAFPGEKHVTIWPTVSEN